MKIFREKAKRFIYKKYNKALYEEITKIYKVPLEFSERNFLYIKNLKTDLISNNEDRRTLKSLFERYLESKSDTTLENREIFLSKIAQLSEEIIVEDPYLLLSKYIEEKDGENILKYYKIIKETYIYASDTENMLIMLFASVIVGELDDFKYYSKLLIDLKNPLFGVNDFPQNIINLKFIYNIVRDLPEENYKLFKRTNIPTTKSFKFQSFQLQLIKSSSRIKDIIESVDNNESISEEWITVEHDIPPVLVIIF